MLSVFAMLAVAVFVADATHTHDDHTVAYASVDGEQEYAGTVPGNRCSRRGNFWIGSWRSIEQHRHIATRTMPGGQVERKLVLIDEHRWLGGWPRHQHRTDCPWSRTLTYV